MSSIATISGQNLDRYVQGLVNPGPYVSASIYSIKGFRPLAYVGKHVNTYYSYDEVNEINKGFVYPDYKTIKLGKLTYQKTSLTQRRFLNYFRAEHDWGHTKGHLYCGKTNKSIICGTYPLPADQNSNDKNQEIRELLNQAAGDLVAAGY